LHNPHGSDVTAIERFILKAVETFITHTVQM